MLLVYVTTFIVGSNMCGVMQAFIYLDVDSFCLGVRYVTVTRYVTTNTSAH